MIFLVKSFFFLRVASLLVRASNGMKWAVVMNLRSAAQSALFFSELDQMMWTAYAGVTVSAPTIHR